MRTITKGAKGAEVSILQVCLRMLQYRGKDGKALNITGYADDNLIYAINQFQIIQEAYGFKCGSGDGSFGPLCWSRLLGV